MTIQENKNKPGYGSWYFSQSFDEKAKQKYGSHIVWDTYNQKKCFDRVASQFNKGDEVRVHYIAGKRPVWYSGIIIGMFFDRMDGGIIHLKQPKVKKVIRIYAIDEVEKTSDKRHCSNCGKAFKDGDEAFVFFDGEEYYCSEECRQDNYTDEEYRQLYMAEEAYWTHLVE